MQRYFATKKDKETFILNNDDLYHIKTVMRMNNDDKIEVVYNQELYICTISNINSDIKINILEKMSSDLKNKYEIAIAIPLLKEQKMDLILQKCTELGVSKIIPFLAERSIIKLNDGKEKAKIERWQKICKEASEQSKRVDIPIVTNIKKLNELVNFDGRKLVCSTKKCVNNIKMVLQNNINCDKLLIVVGPEGGLSDSEEEYLVKNDFLEVTLGKRIMRVETVPLFLLSVINYEAME